MDWLFVGWLVLQPDSPGLTDAAILSWQVGWAVGPLDWASLSMWPFLRRSFVTWWSQDNSKKVNWEPQGLLRPRPKNIPVETSATLIGSGKLEGRVCGEESPGGGWSFFLPTPSVWPQQEPAAGSSSLLQSFSPFQMQPDASPAERPLHASSQ